MTEWPFDPAAVAAGAVDDDEHAAIAEALRADPAFAAEVASYQQLVHQLESLPGVAWDPVPPPALDIAAVTGAPPSPTVERSHRRMSRRARRTLVTAAAVVVVIGAVVAFRSVTTGDGGPAERTVQLAPLAGEPAGVEARVSLPTAQGGTVRVRISGAEPTPDGYVEELWLLNSATDLISLGTYRVGPDGTADVTFSTAADPSQFEFVDVSREPTDGNPAHSGASLLRSAPLA